MVRQWVMLMVQQMVQRWVTSTVQTKALPLAMRSGLQSECGLGQVLLVPA